MKRFGIWTAAMANSRRLNDTLIRYRCWIKWLLVGHMSITCWGSAEAGMVEFYSLRNRNNESITVVEGQESPDDLFRALAPRIRVPYYPELKDRYLELFRQGVAKTAGIDGDRLKPGMKFNSASLSDILVSQYFLKVSKSFGHDVVAGRDIYYVELSPSDLPLFWREPYRYAAAIHFESPNGIIVNLSVLVPAVKDVDIRGFSEDNPARKRLLEGLGTSDILQWWLLRTVSHELGHSLTKKMIMDRIERGPAFSDRDIQKLSPGAKRELGAIPFELLGKHSRFTLGEVLRNSNLGQDAQWDANDIVGRLLCEKLDLFKRTGINPGRVNIVSDPRYVQFVTEVLTDEDVIRAVEAVISDLFGDLEFAAPQISPDVLERINTLYEALDLSV